MATPEEHAASFDPAEKLILSDVEKYGFHIAFIHGDGYSPSFAYTIGLFKTYGCPEFICFGLSQELLHSMLWTAKETFDKELIPNLSVGHPDFLEGYEVKLLPVDKARYQDYFGYGRWFYNCWDFPALQIVWPDKQALFPWEEEFNPDWKFKQPLLDRDKDFKFREERNVAVFTNRQVLEGLPILRVSHETDGDWLFMCGTTTNLDDYRIVCLQEITKRDDTINELYELNYGWAAQREFIGDEWKREESELEEDSNE